MAQWRECWTPTNMARIQFPDLRSDVTCGLSYLLAFASTLLRFFSPGTPVFLPLQNQHSKFWNSGWRTTMWKCVVPEKIHTPPTEGIGNSWGMGDSQGPKNLKKCMGSNWNFLGEGGSYKNPFHGGSMDILWNYTMPQQISFMYSTNGNYHSF